MLWHYYSIYISGVWGLLDFKRGHLRVRPPYRPYHCRRVGNFSPTLCHSNERAPHVRVCVCVCTCACACACVYLYVQLICLAQPITALITLIKAPSPSLLVLTTGRLPVEGALRAAEEAFLRRCERDTLLYAHLLTNIHTYVTLPGWAKISTPDWSCDELILHISCCMPEGNQ